MPVRKRKEIQKMLFKIKLMNKIGLLDIDGHNGFPNLALMKLSTYHRQQGDTVEWLNHFSRYDRVYKSKVFTFTPDDNHVIQADEVIKGGTGYKLYSDLFCDDTEPDYTIYPNIRHAYGFLTRGCPNRCPWCVVPKKEGSIKPYRDIETVLQGRKTAILMDNNVLASDHGIRQLEKISDMKCKVDFNQGLDSRLVTEEIAKLLSKIKWIRYIRFSCDSTEVVDPLIKAISRLNKYGISNYRIFVYLLVTDVTDANERCRILKQLGVIPFAQPYRDEYNTPRTVEQKRFARYVNRKEIFKSIDFEQYE